MSKIASYLQEHISGEVSTNPYILGEMSRDGSILQATPQFVVYPKTTNDIRKIARFSWQLAERGHTLPITARGSGSDQTGAAIGTGVILSFPAHMNRIFEYEPRRKLVRVQPGVNARSLSDALWLHGTGIPALPTSSLYSTLGGAVANNASGTLSGKYGPMAEWVEQLEVVLANGEVIQTGRISKRELNRKKGLETLEGEIYRSVDNLIDDNKELINALAARTEHTTAGYASIASVKQQNGSFDLTPLFVGSQGTLGIISEMILRTEYISSQTGVVLAAFPDKETARDCIAAIAKLDPAFLEYFDGGLLKGEAKHFGLSSTGFTVDAALLIGFDELGDRARAKRIKKISRILSPVGAWFVSANDETAEDLLTVRDATAKASLPEGAGMSAPPLLNGAYIPPGQFGIFAEGVAALSEKYHLALPIFGRELSNLYYVWPVFNLKKTTDKQKMLKMLGDFALLIEKTGGEVAGEGGEGRVKERFARQSFDEDILSLFHDIKTVFDPYGILNPGVKQPIDVKQFGAMIRDTYESPAPANYVPYA